LRLAVSILFLALVALAGPGTQRTNVTLIADYDTNVVSSDMVFKLYTSSDVSVPVTNWTVLTNLVYPGCMINGTNVICTVGLTPGQHFYFMTASNYFGESPPSNVTNAAVLVTLSRLRIQ